MDDKVIHNVMNDVLLRNGRYPENFMMISQKDVRQKEGVKKRGTCRSFRVPEWDIDDRVIHDIINYVLLPQGRYSENFMMISQQEVSQEGGYLEDIDGS